MHLSRPVVLLLLGGVLAAAGAGPLAARQESPLVERLPDDAPAVAPPGYEVLEQYCVMDDDREAFTVFAARLEGPGKFTKTYRFPISRQVYRLRVDTGEGIPMPSPCTHTYSFLNGDNPFNGSGIGVGVNVNEVSRRGVTLDVSLYWTSKEGEHGDVKTSLFFPWQTSASRRLAPDVVVSGWFEKPRPRPAPAPAEPAEPPPPAAHGQMPY